MKNQTKLYGTTVLPAFILFTLIPWYSAIFISIHFGVSVLILFIISKLDGVKSFKLFYKRNIKYTFLCSIISSATGAIYLFFAGTVLSSGFSEDNILYKLQRSIYFASIGYTYHDITSFLFVLSGVAVSGITIFLGYWFFSLSKLNVSPPRRFRLSLTAAVIAAPYVFLIPSEILK